MNFVTWIIWNSRILNKYFLFLGCLLGCLGCLDCTSELMKYPEFDEYLPGNWSRKAVILLHDTLNLEFKNERDSTFLYDHRISWYMINNVSAKTLQTINLYDSEFLEKKPNITITAFYNNGKSKNIHLKKRMRLSKDDYYRYALWVNKESSFKSTYVIPEYNNIQYIRLSVERKYKRPEFINRHTIRSRYPTVEKIITFKYPKHGNLRVNLINPENLPLATSTKIDKKTRSFIVVGNHLKTIDNYSHCKYPENWYAALYFSLPPTGTDSYTWKQLGDYYLDLLSDAIQDTMAIDSIAKLEIFSDKTKIITSAFNYVKNSIRYYGSWEKEFSYIPRTPKEILAKGYGDCKEMATVLTLLLRKHAIHAWPVLVKTSGNFQYHEEFPTLGSFNHMIVAVKDSDDQLLYLDPTNKRYTYTSSYYDLIDQKMFILKKERSEIGVIAPHSSYKNRVITSSQVLLSPDKKNWQIKGNIEFQGEIASYVFRLIKYNTKSEDYKRVFAILGNYFSIHPKEIKIKELTNDKTLISFITDFTESVISSPSQGIILSIPSLYSPRFKFTDLSYEGDRYLAKIEQTDKWTVPQIFKKVSFENLDNQFAEGTWRKTKNKIIRKYSCNFSHIREKNKKHLKSFLTERRSFAHGTAWID